jgi:hypothetical protein
MWEGGTHSGNVKENGCIQQGRGMYVRNGTKELSRAILYSASKVLSVMSFICVCSQKFLGRSRVTSEGWG